MPCRTPDLAERKPMQRSPAASSQEARNLHKHFPIVTGNRSHGFYAQGDGTIVALHTTQDTKPIKGSAGTASLSDTRHGMIAESAAAWLLI
jgi:hypothetical protein